MESQIATPEKAFRPQGPTGEAIAKKIYEGYKSRHSITIGKDPQEVYSLFRNLKNLPLFMKDLVQIDVLSETKSHWLVQVKNGVKVEWDAEITQDVPGQMIGWQTLQGSSVKTSGAVFFDKAPAQLGTVVTLLMDYTVPGGKLTEFALLFTGETPNMLVVTNLKRLKALLETGEIPTIEGQPSGRDENSSSLRH